MRAMWMIILALACAALGACGDDGGGVSNRSLEDAGSGIIRALVEGDRKAIEGLNHSSAMNWPTDHLMQKLSPAFQSVGVKGIQSRPVNGRFLEVAVGPSMRLTLEFLKEKDGYFLVNVEQGAPSFLARDQIASLEKALDLYRLDTGHYPTTDVGLKALNARPDNEPKWNGPYLKKGAPTDPWGRPYIYKSPGEHGEFDLTSLGKDGQPGGEGSNDDVGNWQP